MGRKRRRYPDTFRADAVLMLEAAGYKGDPETNRKGALTAVAKRLDVPHPTLIRWFRRSSNPPPSELVQEKRFNLVAELTDLLGLHITEAKTAIGDAHLSDLDRGIGILVDKLQLLSGEPTERIERLTGPARVDRIAELFEVARTRRTG